MCFGGKQPEQPHNPAPYPVSDAWKGVKTDIGDDKTFKPVHGGDTNQGDQMGSLPTAPGTGLKME